MVNNFELFWKEIQEILVSPPSTNIVFNQYRDVNFKVDMPDAPEIRLNNLYCYLHKRIHSASFLVVGEAAGPWGCRFSGIPFTGEKQLLDPSFPVYGNRSSIDNPELIIKHQPPFISRSAKFFWNTMLQFNNRFLAWDAFPLHSHELNKPFTVRNPEREETNQFGEAVKLIECYMKPESVISVGMKAFDQLTKLGMDSTYVRHPSRGGQKKFHEGMYRIFADRT